LLKVARSTLYYRPLPASADDLRLMRWLDEQFLKTPFYGSRRMVAVMRRDGLVVNRKRVKRLMRVMGIEAIYQKPNTSLGHPAHKVYPYLLRGLIIDRPNQVWCADITYVPMAKGFVYLVAVMDWFNGEGVCVSGRGHGLVQPTGVVVAGVDFDGFGLLRGGATRGHGEARASRDFQDDRGMMHLRLSY
jgi:transposase InsO family protein